MESPQELGSKEMELYERTVDVEDCLETVKVSILLSTLGENLCEETENEIFGENKLCNGNESMTVCDTRMQVETSDSVSENSDSPYLGDHYISPHNNTSGDLSNGEESIPESQSINDCLSSDIEDYNKAVVPIETESVVQSLVENSNEEIHLCNKLESPVENTEFEGNASKNKESSSIDNLQLTPCIVVLERCDNPTESRSFPEKICTSNAYMDQLDIISVMNDTDKKVKAKSKYRKPKSTRSKYLKCSVKKKYGVSCEYPHGVIKGNSKIRKKNSKVFKNISDVSSDSDWSPMRKKNIKVSALVHEPPESNRENCKNVLNNTNGCDDSPMNFTSTLSDGCNSDKVDDIDMDFDPASKKPQNRKRNSSSISSMSFSGLLSDSECINSKRRVIIPTLRNPSSLGLLSQMNNNTESCGSDRDLSDNGFHTCFPQAIETITNQECQTLDNQEKTFPECKDLYSPANSSDDKLIDSLIFKPCQVVLQRCDEPNGMLPPLSPNADRNQNSLCISQSSDSSPEFKGMRKRCNSDRNFSDNSNFELSDTDEVEQIEVRKLGQNGKKLFPTKNNISGIKKSKKLLATKKVLKKSDVINEIKGLKRIMIRAEKKIDKLIKLHMQGLISD